MGGYRKTRHYRLIDPSFFISSLGLTFFEQNVNAQNYLNMLRNEFLPIIREYPNFDILVFQQDGGPPHKARDVRDFLEQNFNNR